MYQPVLLSVGFYKGIRKYLGVRAVISGDQIELFAINLTHCACKKRNAPSLLLRTEAETKYFSSFRFPDKSEYRFGRIEGPVRAYCDTFENFLSSAR